MGIKPVFHHVVIYGRQLDGDELAYFLVNDVKFEPVVSLDGLQLQLRELIQYPPVKAGQLVVRQRRFRRVKIVQIRKLVAQRVADDPVGLADFLDALFADDDVVAIILLGDPEPHDIGAVLPDIGLGGLRFFIDSLALFALGDLLAVFVHHEPVG